MSQAQTDVNEIVNTEPARPGAIRRLLRQPISVICIAYILMLVVVAIFAPQLAPYDPNASDVMSRLQGPSAAHPFGTDDLGRDVLSRSIWGAQVALLASAQAVGTALLIGVPLGLYAGYRGGMWDWITMRIADIEQSIPLLLLAFSVIAILGRGLGNAMLAVSIAFALGYVRLIRAVVLAEKEKLYVDAGRVQGFSTARVLFRHILPNVTAPIIVHSSILLGIALLIEAMLSFLGIGVVTGQASWGGMLEDARRFQSSQPMLSLAPGLLITVTVLAYNLLGDGLRDALSPRQQARRARRRLFGFAPAQATPESARMASAHDADPEALLTVRHLDVEFPREGRRPVQVLTDLSFDIRHGEVFGLVGESGSGKSMTAQAIMGMIPVPGQVSHGSIRLGDRELVGLAPKSWQGIRGQDIGMLFQDPAQALSPVHTIGMQLSESIRAHEKVSRKEALDRAAMLLDRVKVPNARERLGDYPHQFSGGMAQRALIAAALVCRPRLLIADEPTTALDVTVQKEVLELIRELKADFRMSVLFITHDLGVVAEICDRVGVMYAGQLVETGDVTEILTRPRHPYTSSLIAAMPTSDRKVDRMPTIPGAVPPAYAWPTGCRFHTRCPIAVPECASTAPALVDDVRCIRVGSQEEVAP